MFINNCEASLVPSHFTLHLETGIWKLLKVYSYMEIVESLLLNKNIEVELQTIGETPLTALQVTCKYGNLDIVKNLVLDGRADVLKETRLGDTPLLMASSLEVIKFLVIDRKLDANASNRNELTLLYRASYYGNVEVVKWLVSNSMVNVNRINNDKGTVLYMACQNGLTEIVKILIFDGKADCELIFDGKADCELKYGDGRCFSKRPRDYC